MSVAHAGMPHGHKIGYLLGLPSVDAVRGGRPDNVSMQGMSVDKVHTGPGHGIPCNIGASGVTR